MDARLFMENKFFNRDYSWLKFNDRVLFQATLEEVPILEKLKFLAIASNNLDEFVMKRIGYLKGVIGDDVLSIGNDDADPNSVYENLRLELEKFYIQRRELSQKIIPQLKDLGIHFLDWKDLDDTQKKYAEAYFHDKVFPVLTPLAVDKAHPFPFLSNLSVSLGVYLSHPKNNDKFFARLKLPTNLAQWIELPSESEDNIKQFISLQDLVEKHLHELFPEMIIQDVLAFRVTRSADVDQDNDDVEDLLELVEQGLRRRRLAHVVRLEVNTKPNPEMLDLLKEELEIGDEDIFEINGHIDFESFFEIASLNIRAGRYPSWIPQQPKAFLDESKSIFQIINEHDVLVHHPYESFSGSVEEFIKEATNDPHVLAIKMTLYRTGKDSPIIPLLVKAAEKGKQVVCVVELQARFDEERNIYWSEFLEKAGVHVVYGFVGKKIHSKTCLVIREEQDKYRFYAHIGTGNYNPGTAKLYTDLGIFTSDPKITTDLIEVFNYLTGLSLRTKYKKMLLAPINMRKSFNQLIDTEIQNQKKGLPARIMAKMNSLEDSQIIEKLYEASQAGVEVRLLVRGFCSLIPQKKALSENIKVRSCIGQFLEHSRMFCFANGQEKQEDAKFFVGSADWMRRNLSNRIETIVPIKSPEIKSQLWQIFKMHWEDTYQTWELGSDGEYKFLRRENSKMGIHKQFMEMYTHSKKRKKK